MIKIANMGNYAGRDPERENTVDYIEEAILLGYDVKIDVWLLDGKWALGRDFPNSNQIISREFMERKEIWVHACNLVGYVSLYNNPKAHVFWHHKDDFTFTSKGIKWANYGILTHDGVMYRPELNLYLHEKLVNKRINPCGVCSDDLTLY